MVVAPRQMAGDTDMDLLGTAPFIRFRRTAWGLSRTIEQEFARRRIEVDTLAEVDSVEAVLALVANGLGVSVVPRRRIPQPFPDGVRAIPFGDPPLGRTIGVLWREDHQELKPVQHPYRALIEAAADFDTRAAAQGKAP